MGCGDDTNNYPMVPEMPQDEEFDTLMKFGVIMATLVLVLFVSRSGAPRAPHSPDVKLVDDVTARPSVRRGRSKRPSGGQALYPDAVELDQAMETVDWVSGTAEQGPKTDVVIIVLDTVRRDRLGIYGYGGNTTPRLDAWASTGRVYQNAKSVSSWTLPSHASLFTGQYPMTHGVRTAEPGGRVHFYALPDGRATLAGALRDEGYATAGISANRAFLNPRWGLDQGFDLWLCDQLSPEEDIAYVTAERITNLAVGLLEKPREKPIFLFLNYMDAHGPIVPRPDYLAPGVRVTREQMPTSPRGIQHGRALMQGRESLPGELRRAWSEGYDSELRYLDEHVSRLLDRLPALGIDDEDYVIILSDHGEYLGEHELVGHNKDLYEEGIAIPLFMRGPGVQAGTDNTLVQTLDIPRWILDGLDLDHLPNMESTGEIQVAELYWNLPKNLSNKLMNKRFNRVRRAFIRGEQKLILGSDGSVERYDLGDDPREQTQLEQDIWDAAVLRHSEDWLQARQAGAGTPVQASEDEALRALGYVE